MKFPFSIYFGSLLLLLLKYLLGFLIKSKVNFFKKTSSVDILIIGWASFLYLLYAIERFSLPYFLSGTLLIFSFISIFLYRREFLNHLINKSSFLHFTILIILSSPIFLALISPFLFNDFLFFQNWGPDLDGNLISTSALMQHFQFSDFATIFQNFSSSHQWWFSKRIDPWQILDLRNGISIEFFLRSVRWGHAVEGKFINTFLNMPVWYGLQCLILSSGIFSGFLIYQFLAEKKISRLYCILLPLIFATSQSTLLMLYEGINVQYIYAPVFLYLLLNINKIYSSDLTDLTLILLASLILMISFGEGLQIFAVFFTLFSIINYKKIKIEVLIKNLLISAAVFLIFFTAPFVDFLGWSFIRVLEKMDGGALHYQFSMLNIISTLPYFTLTNYVGHDSIKLFISKNGIHFYIANITFIFILLVAGLLVFKKNNEDKANITSVSLLYLLTLFSQHKYALWKVITLTAPFVWICFVKLLKGKSQYLATILIIIICINLIFAIDTIKKYSLISEPVSSKQFEIDKNNIGSCYAILTPHPKRGYLRLATVGPLNWLNGINRQFDLLPNFSNIKDKKCPVVIYFDCSIENRNFCDNNQNQKLKPNFFNVSEKPLTYFLKKDNTPDEKKIDVYLKSIFIYDFKP